MHAIQELFRTIAAILIEEGSYFAAVAISTVVFWKYRYRIKAWLHRGRCRWRQHFNRPKEADPENDARIAVEIGSIAAELGTAAEPTMAEPMKAAEPTQERTSEVPKLLPKHSGPECNEAIVPDEVRLQRAISHLQDQSSLEPNATFHTMRLKQEVVAPLLEYLSDLTSKSMTSTAISCKCIVQMEDKTSAGERWTCWSSSRILQEIPSELANLRIVGKLTVENSESMENESDMIEFKGWFIGDGDGSWQMCRLSQLLRSGQSARHEVPMYDWYGLKQGVSGLVADFLEGL